MNELSMIITSIIVSLVITAISFYIMLRVIIPRIAATLLPDNLGNIIGAAKQRMSDLGVKSGQARGAKSVAKARVSAKNKLVDNIGSIAPNLAPIISILKSIGFTNNEIFAAATDPTIIKGIMVIVNAMGGGLNAIRSALGGEKKADKSGKQWV